MNAVKRYQCTEESFLKDVADHTMNILRDDGVYRHIRFGKPNSGDMHFEMITWPGYLCYCGDMGTYVFWRLTDMFEFFRKEPRDSNQLAINLGYWSEKLQASACSGKHSDGCTEYNEEKFAAVVKERYVGWCREYLRGDPEGRKELREAIDQLLSDGEDGETAAHISARDFHFKRGRREYQFDDFWEHNLRGFTTRFVWCCYALSWGIQQYDKATSQTSTGTDGN